MASLADGKPVDGKVADLKAVAMNAKQSKGEPVSDDGKPV